QRKRRSMMNRIRIVSVLTVILLVVGIAVGGKVLVTPPQHHATQADLQAQLLQLLQEGRLTPEQAAQLAQSMGLENGALAAAGGPQVASAPTGEASNGVAPSMAASSADTEQQQNGLQLASDQQFSTDARDAYSTAITGLLTHPDASVRQAALNLSNPQQRD